MGKLLGSRIGVVWLIVLSLFSGQSLSAETTKILFIGNSYTYFNNMPAQVAAIAQAQQPSDDVEVELVTLGGATLKQLWHEGAAIEAIKRQVWDYVVLQEQSMLGSMIAFGGEQERHIYSPESFYEYAEKFQQLIANHGGKTVFYLTWARQATPEQQPQLTYAYSQIAEKTGALLAPVGEVWQRVNSANPNALYDSDGAHPSPQGSYLAAMTLYATVFNTLPSKVTGAITQPTLNHDGKRGNTPVNTLVEVSPEFADAVVNAITQVRSQVALSNGYFTLTKPEPTFEPPIVTAQDELTQEAIKGKWFGTTSFGSDTVGFMLKVKTLGGEPSATLELVTPTKIINLTVSDFTVSDNLLKFNFSATREMQWSAEFNFQQQTLVGQARTTLGNNHLYDSWQASRKHIQEGVNVSLLRALISKFNIVESDPHYVAKMLSYYHSYSQLLGHEYKPQLSVLHRQVSRYIAAQEFDLALKQAQLATGLYPTSAEAFHVLAEANVAMDELQAGLQAYKKAYEIAQTSGHEKVSLYQTSYQQLDRFLFQFQGAEEKQNIDTEQATEQDQP